VSRIATGARETEEVGEVGVVERGLTDAADRLSTGPSYMIPTR